MEKRISTGTGRFNMPLYNLRKLSGLTQDQFGRMLGGYNGHTVMRIETGRSGGKLDFWRAVQREFNIPSEQMWELMNGVETVIIEGGN